MKEYVVQVTKPTKTSGIVNRTMIRTATKEDAEDYLHNYIVTRIDEQSRFIIICGENSTYYDQHGNIVYDRPEGYQCGAPFWFDNWNLEMFRIYEVENA